MIIINAFVVVYWVIVGAAFLFAATAERYTMFNLLDALFEFVEVSVTKTIIEEDEVEEMITKIHEQYERYEAADTMLSGTGKALVISFIAYVAACIIKPFI